MTTISKAVNGSWSPSYILDKLDYAKGLMIMLSELTRSGVKFVWEYEKTEDEEAMEKAKKIMTSPVKPIYDEDDYQFT